MSWSLADQIIMKLEQTAELVHRLIIVAAPSGTGKTAALLDIVERKTVPLLNVNLELSRRMLDLGERQRAMQLPRLMDELVNENNGDILLLDNIEMLFDTSLKQDPIRILKKLSRNRSIVAAWNGSFDNGYLTYAVPDHPEYKRCNIHGFLVVYPGAAA